MKTLTTQSLVVSDYATVQQEFGRQADVQRIFGLKRGTLYNLLQDGKIRGVLLRVRGQKSGIRLFDMASVREYIREQMDRKELRND